MSDVSSNAVDSSDLFKPLYKSCKSLKCSANLALGDRNELLIVDFTNPSQYDDVITRVNWSINAHIMNDKKFESVRGDFRDPSTWQVYSFDGLIKGLYVIPNILTNEASERWFHHTVNELPHDQTAELKANIELPVANDRNVQQSNLRWITFGYHHNWDSKVYDSGAVGALPPSISTLMNSISALLGLAFNVEAGIINYYTCKSTLGAHTDHSEPNQSAPLLSLSLGSSAIFICGGESKSDAPVIPMLLRSGDLLIMSESSRRSYHAVPKVFCNNADGKHTKCQSKIITRVNLNVRQVM